MKNILIITDYKAEETVPYCLTQDELSFVLVGKDKPFYRSLASGMNPDVLNELMRTRAGRLQVLQDIFKIDKIEGETVSKIITMKIQDMDK